MTTPVRDRVEAGSEAARGYDEKSACAVTDVARRLLAISRSAFS